MLLAKIKPFERRLEEKRKKRLPLLQGVNDGSTIRVWMFGLNISHTHEGKDHSAPHQEGGCIHASSCI